MTHAEALERFKSGLRHAANLIAIHGELNADPGKRYREMSLNRGAVVMAVASWQAFVQDTARALLGRLAVPVGDPAWPSFKVIQTAAYGAIDRFSTPNAENTRDLLRSLGLDPWPAWTWRAGNDDVTPQVAHDRMNGWLKVRHAIAHGDDLGGTALEQRVLTDLGNNRFSLRRSNAERCLFFFSQAAKKTSAVGAALP